VGKACPVQLEYRDDMRDAVGGMPEVVFSDGLLDCMTLPKHYVSRDGTWSGPCSFCEQPTTMPAEAISSMRSESHPWMYRRPRGTSRQRAATSRDRMQDDRRIGRRERSLTLEYVNPSYSDETDLSPPVWAVWRSIIEGTRYA
jgi:hypothetical protein